MLYSIDVLLIGYMMKEISDVLSSSALQALTPDPVG